MTEPTERRRAERRQADPEADEDLSPEYLALLEVCGGEIRATDRAALAERRQIAQAEAEAARAAGQESRGGAGRASFVGPAQGRSDLKS